MDPVGTITNMSALGAIVGAAIALRKGREEEASYIIRGTVAGGAVGVLRVLIEALSS
jgi:hypothetical protein